MNGATMSESIFRDFTKQIRIDYKVKCMVIGVHLCPNCKKEMRRHVHPTHGWHKYACNDCLIVITGEV